MSRRSRESQDRALGGWWGVLTLTQRAGSFVAAWWVLTEGQPGSWYLGIPLILLAGGLSIVLIPPSLWSFPGLLRFVPYFVGRSLEGAVDVAWRALCPGPPLDPDLVEYRLRLPAERARVFLANTISLLPGTLSAELEDGHLQVHVLDRRRISSADFESLERKVAALFRISMD